MKERVMECSQPDSVCADDHAIVNQMNPFNVFNREVCNVYCYKFEYVL